MQELERLVVHVEEGIRLGTAPDEAHLRLGLILLDSAAELIMHRQCAGLLIWSESYDHLLKSMEWIPEANRDENYATDVAEMRSRVVSNTRRKRIEREFDAKADFLHENNLLAGPQARVLKKLHQYRNDTYHRDKIRPATLASAAKIYIYLICTMMRDIPEQVGFAILYHTSDVTPFLSKYIDTSKPGPLPKELRPGIAKQLMDTSGVGEPQQLGSFLAQHVHDRLSDTEKWATWTIDWFEAVTHDETWDVEASVRMAQASPKQLRTVRTADDARALDIPVGLKQIREWRRRADNLRSETDDLHAFAAFADLEDAFEPVEAKIDEMVMIIDGEIQHQIDLARGK